MNRAYVRNYGQFRWCVTVNSMIIYKSFRKSKCDFIAEWLNQAIDDEISYQCLTK